MINRLGRRFAVDTNIVGNTSPSVRELWSLHADGWIQLVKTDTVDTELMGAPEAQKRERLLAEAAPLVEQLGPLVLDHSRLGFAVLGSHVDQASLDRVIRTLYGADDPRMPGARRGKQRLRDAMHVNTAQRYALDGLITLDNKDLLNRADAISRAFDGAFQLFHPDRA